MSGSMTRMDLMRSAASVSDSQVSGHSSGGRPEQSPSSSQLGTSYSHFRIISFITASSSSSKGSDPVRRV